MHLFVFHSYPNPHFQCFDFIYIFFLIVFVSDPWSRSLDTKKLYQFFSGLISFRYTKIRFLLLNVIFVKAISLLISLSLFHSLVNMLAKYLKESICSICLCDISVRIASSFFPHFSLFHMLSFQNITVKWVLKLSSQGPIMFIYILYLIVSFSSKRWSSRWGFSRRIAKYFSFHDRWLAYYTAIEELLIGMYFVDMHGFWSFILILHLLNQVWKFWDCCAIYQRF